MLNEKLAGYLHFKIRTYTINYLVRRLYCQYMALEYTSFLCARSMLVSYATDCHYHNSIYSYHHELY